MLGELPNIIGSLVDQCSNRKDVEILSLLDNYRLSVGEKRNKLIEISSGKYITFIDDDDMVVGNYVQEILKCLYDNPDLDLVSYNMCLNKGFKLIDGRGYGKTCIVFGKITPELKLENDVKAVAEPDSGYSHTHVWKKSLVSGVKFKDISFAEDREWCLEASPLVKNVKHIDKIMYYYNFSYENSETRIEAENGTPNSHSLSKESK